MGDPEEFANAPKTCAYQCAAECDEDATPYACPSLGEWAKIPHAEACSGWNGKYPEPAVGQCEASAPTGDAAKYAGPDPDVPGGRILPDGRPTKPSGAFAVFTEPDLRAGLTTGIVAVPGTPFVLTIDSGKAHVVRAVDTRLIGSQDPVSSYYLFEKPEYLSSSRGVVFVPPNRILAGTSAGRVRALSIDMATGVLSTDEPHSIALPPLGGGDTYYASSVAVSPDGTRMVVTGFNDKRAAVYDLTEGADYGVELGLVDIGATEAFGVYFDENEATGRFAYVSSWKTGEVLELDLADPSSPAVTRRFDTDKNPQGMVFLDTRWMVAVNDLGETLSLIDRTTSEVRSIPIEYDLDGEGLDTSSVAYDAPRNRLYVAMSGINTVAAYDVDTTATVPTFTPVGRLAAGWWPSAIAVHESGDVSVTTLRGWGAGPVPDDVEEDAQRGGVQHILAPSVADLAQGEADALAAVDVASRPGYPAVTCPAGVDDFPIPRDNTSGPSALIDHVIFVVRENKTFDAVFGDMPGVKGDPTQLLRPADVDKIWGNLRALAKAFTHSDNSYTDADASVQGHAWTTYGRTTDYCERVVRNNGVETLTGCGVADISRPEEGSLFDWLQEQSVRYDILGEIVGQPSVSPDGYNPVDIQYPGGPFQSIGYPDTEKACHVAGRARVLCDLNPFIYMTLPNDHGAGVDLSTPTPTLMIAVNDVATGMLVDAVSHSPIWKSTLILITEDDPQQGGDHVDYHRVPFVVVSPWVKRGYVSKTHMTVAGVFKLFAHVFGLPYPNVQAQHAAIPYDMFTSTPDYTPYTYLPRSWPLECGTAATSAERRLTKSWSYDRADAQPGIDAQVVRWLRGEQLTELPPELEEEVAARMRERETSN